MVAAHPSSQHENRMEPRTDVAALGAGSHFHESNQINTHHDNHALAAGKYEAAAKTNLGDHFPASDKVIAGVDGGHGHKGAGDQTALPKPEAQQDKKADTVKSETADKVVAEGDLHPVSTAGNDTKFAVHSKQQTDTTTSYAANDAPSTVAPSPGRGADFTPVEANRPSVSPEVASTQPHPSQSLFPARNDMV